LNIEQGMVEFIGTDPRDDTYESILEGLLVKQLPRNKYMMQWDIASPPDINVMVDISLDIRSFIEDLSKQFQVTKKETIILFYQVIDRLTQTTANRHDRRLFANIESTVTGLLRRCLVHSTDRSTYVLTRKVSVTPAGHTDGKFKHVLRQECIKGPYPATLAS